MKIDELKPEHLATIRKFVNSEEFLEIKDAFVSHTPQGGTDGNRNDDPAKLLGMFLGTRFPFNKMEELSRQQPKKKQTVQESTGIDPDLET